LFVITSSQHPDFVFQNSHHIKMPLGMLAKDSMVNLAELASKMEEESQKGGDAADVSAAEDGEVKRLLDGGDSKHDDDDHDPSDINNPSDVGDVSAPNVTLRIVVTGNSERSTSSNHAAAGIGGIPGAAVLSTADKASANSTPALLDSFSNHNALSSEEKSEQHQQQDAEALMEAARAQGQYTGFSSDYHDFEHYVKHSYVYEEQPGSGVPVNLGLTVRGETKQWWCCLFPWMEGDHMELEDGGGPLAKLEHGSIEHSQIHAESPGSDVHTSSSRGSSADEDEVSTSSEMFGEKLSEKDRQAVLARLRLAPPDEKQSSASSVDLADISQETTEPPTPTAQHAPKGDRPRSILRKSSTLAASRESLSKFTQNGGVEASAARRRSLFPTYEQKDKKKKDLHASFSPMARVVTIKSLKDMTEREKADIWWQKFDYEEFRKTGRMIAKAMLEGGSEIWLATNQSWQTPNQGKAATLQNASSLAERHAAFKNGDRNAKIEYEDTRDKWWHTFGHSRRGLEHIASIDEGRQRQANVKASIKAVLDEQRRQKDFHREDADKLRMVSVNNTSWARDLALASGASDADAVSKNFDDESRRSREFYLLKFSRANMLSQKNSALKSSSEKVVPAFMEPMMMMQIPANRLDAHTTSQIRFRQKQHQRTASGGDALSSTNKSNLEQPSTHHRTMSAPSAVAGNDESGIILPTHVPIQDDSSTASIGSDGQPKSSGKSLAKIAAGFSDGIEEGDMSAVLTGMGAIPKAKKAVTQKPGTVLPKGLYVSTVFMMMFCITGAAAMSSRFERHWQLYPRSYVAQRLSDSSLLDQLDGDLGKEVWKDVPFSADFSDIRGPDSPPNERPTASTRTRFKAVWDDSHVYIGAIMENHRTDLPTQAHFRDRNSPIFQKDSDFEIFVDVNGCNHHYKEFEGNAINTVWNLMLDKPYADGGKEHSGRIASDPNDPLYYEVYGQKSATRVVDGTLNNPTGHGATWSIEVALSYKDLWSDVESYDGDADLKDRNVLPPRVGSMMRINFSRVERQGDINWTWQPQIAWDPASKRHSGFVDMHRPDAWGYLYFAGSEDELSEEEGLPRDLSWPGRLAAMNLYYAQHEYFQQNGKKRFASSMDQLHDFIDESIVSPFDITIQTNDDGSDGMNFSSTFEATVSGNPDGSIVTIRNDRFVTVVRPSQSSDRTSTLS
jgi:hypothetical protein